MQEIVGNLFDHNEKGPSAICITTNGFVNHDGANTMGRGCAAEAKYRWPGIQTLAGRHIRDFGNICQLLTVPGSGSNVVLPIGKRWGGWVHVPYHIAIFPVKPDEVVVLPDLSNVVQHKRTNTTPGSKIPGWAGVADLELIKTSAMSLAFITDTWGFQSVVLPRPGCGAGELDWEKQVRPVLQGILDDRFFVITFPTGG